MQPLQDESIKCKPHKTFLKYFQMLWAFERLSYLYWLPVHYSIQFKIAILTYKTLATCQSSYPYNILQLHQPSRALRSSAQQLLQVPYMSTDFGRRAFSYSSPATWNSIPTSIKNCPSLYSFKRHFHLVTCPRLRFMLNVWLCARYKFSYIIIIKCS